MTAVVVGLLSSAIAALSWSNPTTTPPSGTLSAPLNTGSTAQTKTGSLTIATSTYLATTGGNVGIGTTGPGQKLTIEGSAPIAEIRTGGYLMLRPTANDWDMRLQAVSGNKLNIYSGGDLVNPIATFVNGGNVGIGTTGPGAKLDVQENNSLVGNATGIRLYQAGAGDSTVSFRTTATEWGIGLDNSDSDKFKISNFTGTGDFGSTGLTIDTSGKLLWGNASTRTDSKDDAGLIASKSGFFETAAPVNYYSGASSWQHLIEARHSNDGNNYAMQFAGSFFDQNLYFRKTNNSPTTAWNKVIVGNIDGIVSQQAWQAVTFQNGWYAYDQTPGYFKDSLGIVHLKGGVAGGTTGCSSAIFTLPAGYRPGQRKFFAVMSNNTLGRVDVQSTGVVSLCDVGSNVRVYLDNVQFLAEL